MIIIGLNNLKLYLTMFKLKIILETIVDNTYKIYLPIDLNFH
jgi:hypothetical protein